MGSLPARSGVWIVAASGLVGLIATVLAGSEPGDLLGLFLVAGTLAAALAVRADAVHSIIPAPALFYLAAGLIAGLIHDRATDNSRTALLIHALQWIAGGFLAITAATLLAIGFTVARRFWTTPSAGYQRHRSAGRLYPDRSDPESHYLYRRNPDDRTDASLRSSRHHR